MRPQNRKFARGPSADAKAQHTTCAYSGGLAELLGAQAGEQTKQIGDIVRTVGITVK